MTLIFIFIGVVVLALIFRTFFGLTKMDEEKTFMGKLRRYLRWEYRDASPILPIDPLRPISRGWNDQTIPLGQRFKNFIVEEGLWILALIISLVIIFAISNLFSMGQ